MASLILLLGSLSYIMILAVLNGSLGFVSAMGVTVFGALGVVLRKFRIPLGPFILGFLIGPSAERALRQTLSMGNNDVMVLFQRPIAIAFYVATIAFICIIAYTFRKNKETLDKGAHSDDE